MRSAGPGRLTRKASQTQEQQNRRHCQNQIEAGKLGQDDKAFPNETRHDKQSNSFEEGIARESPRQCIC